MVALAVTELARKAQEMFVLAEITEPLIWSVEIVKVLETTAIVAETRDPAYADAIVTLAHTTTFVMLTAANVCDMRRPVTTL